MCVRAQGDFHVNQLIILADRTESVSLSEACYSLKSNDILSLHFSLLVAPACNNEYGVLQHSYHITTYVQSQILKRHGLYVSNASKGI